MSVATEDRDTLRRSGDQVNLSMAAAAKLFLLTLACKDSSGNAKPAADTAGLEFAGVAMEQVDNSSGVAGDETVELYTTGAFLFDIETSVTDAHIGREVYIVDDQTVDVAGGANVDNHIACGRIMDVESSSTVWVQIDSATRAPVETREVTFEIVGTNAAALDLSTNAADFGGSDLYVEKVLACVSYVTSSGALDSRKKLTTDFTLASGVITTVADETANTWVVTAKVRIQP